MDKFQFEMHSRKRYSTITELIQLKLNLMVVVELYNPNKLKADLFGENLLLSRSFG